MYAAGASVCVTSKALSFGSGFCFWLNATAALKAQSADFWISWVIFERRGQVAMDFVPRLLQRVLQIS